MREREEEGEAFSVSAVMTVREGRNFSVHDCMHVEGGEQGI